MSTLIPCELDTTPMAAEMQSVSHHVAGTTAAVVTMQSAVIAAEKNSADKVCKNVNRGFFTLIQSQVSQKIANKQSRVEALLMQLAQQKRQILSIKDNMQREYERISERYQRIFTSINKELETRIRQVDEPIFNMVNKHMQTSSNRMNALTAWISTLQKESILQSQEILMSNMKHNAQVALEQSHEFLKQISEQRVITDRILISNSVGNGDKLCQIPVIIFDTVNNPTGITHRKVSAPDQLSEADATAINNTVRTADDLPWRQGGIEPAVKEEFCNLLGVSQSSPRVKDVVSKMFSSSQFETL